MVQLQLPQFATIPSLQHILANRLNAFFLPAIQSWLATPNSLVVLYEDHFPLLDLQVWLKKIDPFVHCETVPNEKNSHTFCLEIAKTYSFFTHTHPHKDFKLALFASHIVMAETQKTLYTIINTYTPPNCGLVFFIPSTTLFNSILQDLATRLQKFPTVRLYNANN